MDFGTSECATLACDPQPSLEMNPTQSAFASLAHIRVLLLPVGGISKSKFEAYADLIRDIDHVRLVDIPADPREDKC